MAALLNDGHAPAVIELTEYALARLEKAIGNMDDSDGYMRDILPELQNLHHRAWRVRQRLKNRTLCLSCDRAGPPNEVKRFFPKIN